jgi:hypothetical protein
MRANRGNPNFQVLFRRPRSALTRNRRIRQEKRRASRAHRLQNLPAIILRAHKWQSPIELEGYEIK